MQKWQCRVAPSLGGGFEGTPNEVWGTTDYKDQDKPTVFFGLYGLPDFYALWRHKGKKAILWAGSDIRHFKNGYWLDDEGKIRLDHHSLAKWINKNCDSWVENDVEAYALYRHGIKAKVVPSFLGDVKDYPILYEQNKKPKVYTSVSGNEFKLYGWDRIDGLAEQHPEIEFHLYGNDKWSSEYPNVIVHGRVPIQKMNEEIMRMQGALRLTKFDGFSEILAKSILWGQWPVSLISYPHMLAIDRLGELKDKHEANVDGREYYLKKLNKYPWNQNI